MTKNIQTPVMAAAIILLVMALPLQGQLIEQINWINISIADDKILHGDPVVFKITVADERLIDVKSAKFKCCIYVKDAKGFREFSPSLEAKEPKQIDPVYEVVNEIHIKWNYADKPNFFRPETGAKYYLLLTLINPDKGKIAFSQPFEFVDR